MTINEIFGDVIVSYTSEDAMQDGFLDEVYPNRFPKLLLSRNIMVKIDEAILKREESFDRICYPLCLDIAMEGNRKKRKIENGDFAVLEHTVAGKIWISLNEFGGLTAYTPEEY